MNVPLSSLSLALLILLTPFQSVLSVEPKIGPVRPLFRAGDKGVNTYRIPALIRAKNGDLIALADARHVNAQDLNRKKPIDIAIRRSADNGKSWSPIELVYDFPEGTSASDPSIVLDRDTGSLFCFYNVWEYRKRPGVYQHFVQESRDHGKSWLSPRNITADLRRPEWHEKSFVFITSGNGTQLRDGTLLHTMVHVGKNVVLFGSRDHGRSWGPVGTPASPGDECKVIELKDGRWMINTRVNGAGTRWVHLSDDCGKSWISHREKQLPDPGCNAALLRFRDKLLFLNADSPDRRHNLTLKMSRDEGKSWSRGWVIEPLGAAYPDMAVLSDREIGILFETAGYRTISFTTVTF